MLNKILRNDAIIEQLNNIKVYLLSPDSYRKGLTKYRSKKWKEALHLFQSAVTKSPSHPSSNFKLGVCHLKLGNLQEAQLYLNKAISLAPFNNTWGVQLEQCKKKLDSFSTPANTSASSVQPSVPRIMQAGTNKLIDIQLRKKLLLIPSDYNHRVLADILPFVKYYKLKFDIYIILRELSNDLIKKREYTLIKNTSSYAEFLKFTADYVIDAGTMNYGYRITDKIKWISVWHGIPYKKMFVDLDIKHISSAIRYALAYDSMISMSDFYTNTFLRNSMGYDGEILQLGCAKADDILAPDNIDVIASDNIKERLGISVNKKVVIYAPHQRSYDISILQFSPRIILDKLKGKYSFIIMSPNENEIFFEESEDVIFCTPENLSHKEALIIGDILISDYHSLINAFDKINKSIVLFQYDYELFLRNNKEYVMHVLSLIESKNVVFRTSKLYALDWHRIDNNTRCTRVNRYSETEINRAILNIPTDKKIILYAPTYRKAGAIKLPFNPEILLQSVNNEYIIITKLHYLNSLAQPSSMVLDFTSTVDLKDLMKIADILISDYSSLIFDFALLHKPIILFQYDYFEYTRDRGMYFDFEDYLPSNQIIDHEMGLYHLDWNDLSADNSKLLKKFYPLEDGKSTQRIVNALNFDSAIRKTKDIIFLVNELNQIGGIHAFIVNMAKYYKQNYNTRIFVIAIHEFAQNIEQFYRFESPYVDFTISNQLYRGACSSILQNTDGIVISLQFSAHLHFQKHLTNAKSLLMFHGDVKDVISQEMYGPHLGWLNEKVLYNYDKLLLLTQSAIELFRPHLCDELRDKLDYVHNSIDTEFKALPPNITSLNNTVVISRLDEDKNIFVLLDLAEAIKASNKNIVINIYGDGKLRNKFTSAIEEHELGDILILRDYEPNKEKIFSDNNSLLVVSKSEGFGLVILEAYSYGRPVVVFDSFTAAKDVVKHGETGFLVSYGDYHAVIARIEQVSDIQVKNIEKHFRQFENDIVFSKWNDLFCQMEANVFISENEGDDSE